MRGNITHLYRNKLYVAERRVWGPADEGAGGRSGGRCPSPGSKGGTLSGGFSAARRGTIKCNFTAAPQAGKERFLRLFQIMYIYSIYIWNFALFFLFEKFIDNVYENWTRKHSVFCLRQKLRLTFFPAPFCIISRKALHTTVCQLNCPE